MHSDDTSYESWNDANSKYTSNIDKVGGHSKIAEDFVLIIKDKLTN